MAEPSIVLSESERQRIHVVGTSGSGKTTLARKIAKQLNIPHVELDRLHWLPNWQEESNQHYRDKLKSAISGSRWVVDGNYYSKSVDIQWAENGGATTVVWCDLPFHVTFFRAIKRAFHRAWTQEECWPGTGNRETFRKSFFSHDSIVLWTIVSYRANKKRYADIINNNRFPHIRFVRLRNQKSCDKFLQELQN